MAPHTGSATPEQINTLLNFLDEHRDLARGRLRSVEGKVQAKRLWEEICNHLNSMGGCTKTVQQWQKVWFDKKHLTKKAAAESRRSASATGGGPPTEPQVTAWELKVLSIMGDGSSVRWFRLRGNLLFYLKGPEPWYEPLGIIVLGNHQISVQAQDENGHWPFQIVWDNGVCYRMGTFLESERTLWLKAMAVATFEHLTQRIADLHQQINDTRTTIDLQKFRVTNKIINDFNEVPLCELSLSCDNLLCDANGNPPSAFASVYVMFLEKEVCVRYCSTEVVEKCSNPSFSRTVMFRGSDGITSDMHVRVVVYDVRESVTQTGVAMGSLTMRLSHIQEAQRLRVPLLTVEDRTVGFVTINGWSLEPAVAAASPTHANSERNSIDLTPKIPCHRRSQSLPPRLGLKLKYPSYGVLFRQNFVHPQQATYRFHSGLGGEITVHEATAEPRFCFTMPLQIVNLYMSRDKDQLETMLAFAEVGNRVAPRQVDYVCNHLSVMRLLQASRLAQEHTGTHLSTLKVYQNAKNTMMKYNAPFKPSSRKEDPDLAFVPVNLHLQRTWVHNDTLNKTGFHDVITVGAFSAHSLRTDKPGGLIKLVQQCKDVSTQKAEMMASTNRLEAEYDKMRDMKSLREVIAVHMDSAVLLLKARKFEDIQKPIAEIRSNVTTFLALWSAETVEEAMSKVGWNKRRIDQEAEEIRKRNCVAEGKRALAPGPKYSPKTAAAAAKVNALSAPEVPQLDLDIAAHVEAALSGSSNVKPSAGALAVLAALASHKTHISNISNMSNISNIGSSSSSADWSPSAPDMQRTAKEQSPRSDSGSNGQKGRKPARGAKNNRVGKHAATAGRNAARLVEAHAAAETCTLRVDFKNSSSLEQVTFKSLLDINKKGDKKKGKKFRHDSREQVVIKPDPGIRNYNLNFFRDITLAIEDILYSVLETLGEMIEKGSYTVQEFNDCRILMDLLVRLLNESQKWTRLAHTAMRIEAEPPSWTVEHGMLRTRRDICFAHALTTATAGLVSWLTTCPVEIVAKVIQSGLGPLCGFEGLLSLYANEKTMWGDMVVAIEDLHTVVFKFVKLTSSTEPTCGSAPGGGPSPCNNPQCAQCTPYIPQVTGSRNSLVVELPISHTLYARFEGQEKQSFTVTAVFFNIGINEKASVAEALGDCKPQHHSNSDNLERLTKYYHKFCKLFPQDPMEPLRASSRSKPLEEVMENLRAAVQRRAQKDVEVLQAAALATRLMHGIRFTSCKSAKDRTGMSVTLEQATVLANEYHLADHERKRALDVMRSEGCRRANTLKNIGLSKYAFSKKQVQSLPEDYRPPQGSYGTTMT